MNRQTPGCMSSIHSIHTSEISKTNALRNVDGTVRNCVSFLDPLAGDSGTVT